jgi:hypothetical protein
MRRLLVSAMLAVTALFTSAYRPFQDIQNVCPKCPEKGDRVLLTDGRTIVCDVIGKNQDGYILQRFGELRFVQYQEIAKVMWTAGAEPKGLDNLDQILVNNKEQTVLHGTLIEVEAGKPLSMRNPKGKVYQVLAPQVLVYYQRGVRKAAPKKVEPAP